MTAPAMMLRRAAETFRRLWEIPDALTTTEWAEKYRVLPETSTSPGPYDPSVVPYARRWQDLLADPTTSKVAMCWAVQTTKSTVFENAIAFRVCRMPTPMVIVQPKIDAAEAWAKERFVPMILATPALRQRVRLGRSSDSTLRYKRFPGGFIYVASAQSATELASRSSPFVLVDEADRMEIIPGEGNPVEIVARRQGAADIGMFAITSTPRDAETTIIWPYLEAGTFEYYHVPCPHCGFKQRLEWQRLRWEKGKPETAHYVCCECACVIEESEKRAMLAAGEWVATNPDAPYPSSHLNALYSPFGKSSWAVLAAEWESCQGKPADLQVFVNTRLAELWAETADVTSVDSLTQRLEALEEHMVPDGVGILTAGCDVQYNRIEVYVWGWGAGLESWPIASFVLTGDPQQEVQSGGVWAELDQVLARTFKHVSGREVPVSAALIDSGYATTQVYNFTKRRAHRKIFAAKGVGGEGVPIGNKPTLQRSDRVILYAVGTDAAKTEFLRSQIPTPQAGPGFVHLADWLTTEQCEQLVAEKRTRRIHRGQVIREWRKKKDDSPNEALDCRVYARAALEVQGLGARVVTHLGALADGLSLPQTEPPDPRPPVVDDITGEPLPASTSAPRTLQPRGSLGRGSWWNRGKN